MGMLQRLRDAHPGVTITGFDGHFCRIGDNDSHLLDHLTISQGLRTANINAIESGRRNPPKAKAIEKRLDQLIANFQEAHQSRRDIVIEITQREEKRS